MDSSGLMNGTGGVLTCLYCPVVAHTECVKRVHFDLPHGKEDHWTCWSCARAIGSTIHNSNCDECNEGENLIIDIGLGIDLLASLETSVKTSVDASVEIQSSSSITVGDVKGMKVSW